MTTQKGDKRTAKKSDESFCRLLSFLSRAIRVGHPKNDSSLELSFLCVTLRFNTTTTTTTIKKKKKRRRKEKRRRDIYIYLMQVCKPCGTPNASIFNSPSPLRLTRLMLTTEPTERGKNLKRMLFHSRAAASRSSFLFWSVLFFSMLGLSTLTFSTTRKKNCRGREKQRDVAERKREIFFFSR